VVFQQSIQQTER